jgi:uncharacterized membrane protein YdjX (TVP38/TMEM64 family)
MALKKSFVTILAISFLSLAIWYFFYITLGDQLTSRETALVVAISAGLVFAIRGIYVYIRKRRKKDE